MFLLDSSDEMQDDFMTAIGFIERIIEKLIVGENKDRVAVIQYSEEPSVDFFLNTHKTQQSVVYNVQNMKHKGGRHRYTGKALKYIQDNILTVSSGSRRQQGIPQILVLLTGGRSGDDVRNAAENLKGIDVRIFVVGIKNADILEIQSITQDAGNAFLAPDLRALSDIEHIISTIEKDEKPAIPPALHGKIVILHTRYIGVGDVNHQP